jgi:hypothetical protein
MELDAAKLSKARQNGLRVTGDNLQAIRIKVFQRFLRAARSTAFPRR